MKSITTDPVEKDILTLIKELEDVRRKKNVLPIHVSMHDLAKAYGTNKDDPSFLEELRSLYRAKKIGCYNTINYLAFYTIVSDES